LEHDTTTSSDFGLPATFRPDKALVVKMKLGRPKVQADQLMDAKM
jgi:hypothetical protein